MNHQKIRIDRILGVVLITILTATLILFAVKLLIGNTYKQPNEATYIFKTSTTMAAEKVITTTLLAEEVNLDNISEELKTKYLERKNALIAANTEKTKLEDLKAIRKEFELVLYDIKNTHIIALKDNKEMKVENGIHYSKGVMVVNKKYPLPDTYAPKENPEAKNSVLKLILKMQELNYPVSSKYVGFVDFETQKQLYKEVYDKEGLAKAEEKVLRAGHSEHQTGLAFTILNKSNQNLNDEKALAWLKDNAHLYGFIIRYPKDKEAITGVSYRPYELRYLGEVLAKEVYESKLSFEEFFHVEGGNYSE